MIWALLALLGIPLWFIVLVLVAALGNRRAVTAGQGTFRFRTWTGKGWSRRRGVARWVSDVLVEHKGIALIRSDAEHVTHLEVADASSDHGTGHGDDLVELCLTVAGRDEPLVIAVHPDAVRIAQGPFSGSPLPGA